MTPRTELNAKRCSAPTVDDEAEHFIVCAACGQAIDCRNLGTRDGDTLQCDDCGKVLE